MPDIQLTIDWMAKYGGKIEYTPDYKYFKVEGGQRYANQEIFIHPDWSSVVFPLVAAVCTPSDLTITGVNFNDAQGDTHFTNLAHVRIKESDRVAVMSEVLSACGVDVDITSDSMTVHGGKPIRGAVVPSYGDHRVAMAMSVCGLMCQGEMKILDAECVSVSFPDFYETFNQVGAGFEVKENSPV